jgi:heme exporter protein D
MNWSEFFSMGGYGFYVWGSYLCALILLGGEVISLMRRKKSLAKRADRDPRQD